MRVPRESWARSCLSVSDEVGRKLPLVWARRYGEGRVFYSGPGHLKETWRNRIVRCLVTRGLAWALGR